MMKDLTAAETRFILSKEDFAAAGGRCGGE
jgi:hypothetical protein